MNLACEDQSENETSALHLRRLRLRFGVIRLAPLPSREREVSLLLIRPLGTPERDVARDRVLERGEVRRRGWWARRVGRHVERLGGALSPAEVGELGGEALRWGVRHMEELVRWEGWWWSEGDPFVAVAGCGGLAGRGGGSRGRGHQVERRNLEEAREREMRNRPQVARSLIGTAAELSPDISRGRENKGRNDA